MSRLLYDARNRCPARTDFLRDGSLACVCDRAQSGIDRGVIRKNLDQILVDQAHTSPIDHTEPVGIGAALAEINLVIERIVVSGFGFLLHSYVVPEDEPRVR